jgi:hypothetical protein
MRVWVLVTNEQAEVALELQLQRFTMLLYRNSAMYLYCIAMVASPQAMLKAL